MTIKEIVGECLVKMGENNFVDDENLDKQKKELLSKLVNAINLTYREIVAQYLPLVYTQKVNVSDRKINISALDKNILYPIAIKQNDEKKTFFTSATDIFCDATGEVEIRYAYVPREDVDIDGTIDDIRLTRSAICDGALAEYYFEEKVFELAKSFDSDFRAQMGILRYKGKNITIKRRRWQA